MTDTRSPITASTAVKLPLAAWLLLTASFGGVLGTFAVAQYRLNDHEVRLEHVESQLRDDAGTWARVDERTKHMQAQLDAIQHKLETK